MYNKYNLKPQNLMSVINLYFFKYVVYPINTIRHRKLSYSITKFSKSRIVSILETMPRSLDKHIMDAQKQRQILKERSLKYTPGTVTLQVLGSGARGAPKSLYIFTDQSRYLFNCGEGTQRLAHEHKMKLARLEHIFLTTANWVNTGGLPGVALTLQDVGVPKITLHGPPGLDELFIATRKFVILKDMKIEMHPCDPMEPYEDGVMTLQYVPLIRENRDQLNEKCESTSSFEYDFNNDAVADDQKTKGNSKHISKASIEPDNTDYYAHESKRRRRRRSSKNSRKFEWNSDSPSTSGRRNVQNTQVDHLFNAPRKEQFCTMVYICKLKNLLGTLDLQKCVDRGVKPGPTLGLLKNGQDVTLPNGTIVYAKDVRTPDDPGPVFIVIDIPDSSFLPCLEKSTDFTPYQEKTMTNPELEPSVIVHFTPNAVVQDPRYQSFIKSFSSNTCHLLINDENACSGSIAIHRVQRKLHLLNKNIFPLMMESEIPITYNCPDPEVKQALIDQMKEIENKVATVGFEQYLDINDKIECNPMENSKTTGLINAKTFTTFHLRPKKGLDHSSELRLNVLEYIKEAMDSEGFPASLQNLYGTIQNLQYDAQKFPNFVFFGTGSCIPNKTRNTSGIMVHTDENLGILMDCGEGTFGQMIRFYGKDRADDVLCNLKAIYLSHLHADHHLGLIGVLQGRRQALNRHSKTCDHPLYLIAPQQIMSWLLLYDKRFERILDEFEIIPNSSLIKSNKGSETLPDSILQHMGLSDIETCRVRHCPNSFGVTITTKNHSKKITYSGDTMPCEALIDIGRDSDLLIHEATMEDELLGEAKRKMHSTTGQAIFIGQSMGAKFTLLTHFSQRYARVPRLSPALISNSQNHNFGISFDNMQFTLGELCILPHLYPTLKLMFAEHCEELEFRAAKRARKRERCQSPMSQKAGNSRSFSTDSTSREPKTCFIEQDSTVDNVDNMESNDSQKE